MEPIYLEAGEEILVRCRALYAPGLLARAGEVTVTSRRVVFRPNRLEAIAGTEEWTVRIEELEDVTTMGLDRALVLHTTDTRYRLLGSETALLRSRLTALLASLGRAPRPQTDFLSTERVLLHGAVDLRKRGPLAVRGRISLTTEKLIFKANQVDRVFFGYVHLDIPLSTIQSVEYAPLRRVTTLVARAGTWHFGGHLSAALHALLLACLDEVRTCGSAMAVDSVECLHLRGALPSPGILVTTSRGLRFSPTGRLNNVLGAVDELDLPFAHLRRVAVASEANDSIEIVGDEGSFTFGLPDAGTTFQHLVSRLLTVPHADEPVLTADTALLTAEDTAALLGAWLEWLPREHLAEPRLACPVAIEEGPLAMARGWLVLTGTAAIVLPSLVPGEREPVVFDEELLLEPRPSDTLSGRLVLAVSAEETTLLPRGGHALCEQFWSLRPEREEASRSRRLNRRFSRDPNLPRERRDSFRVVPPEPLAAAYRLELALVPDSGALEEPTWIRDLSTSGVGLFMDTRMPKGSVIAVVFSPDQGAFDVVCKVVHVGKSDRPGTPWRIGTTFWEADPECLAKVEELWSAIQRSLIRQQKDHDLVDGYEEAPEVELEPDVPETAEPQEDPQDPNDPDRSAG